MPDSETRHIRTIEISTDKYGAVSNYIHVLERDASPVNVIRVNNTPLKDAFTPEVLTTLLKQEFAAEKLLGQVIEWVSLASGYVECNLPYLYIDEPLRIAIVQCRGVPKGNSTFRFSSIKDFQLFLRALRGLWKVYSLRDNTMTFEKFTSSSEEVDRRIHSLIKRVFDLESKQTGVNTPEEYEEYHSALESLSQEKAEISQALDKLKDELTMLGQSCSVLSNLAIASSMLIALQKRLKKLLPSKDLAEMKNTITSRIANNLLSESSAVTEALAVRKGLSAAQNSCRLFEIFTVDPSTGTLSLSLNQVRLDIAPNRLISIHGDISTLDVFQRPKE